MNPWDNSLNPITMCSCKKRKSASKSREDVAKHRMKYKKEKPIRSLESLDLIYQICTTELGDFSGPEKTRESFVKRSIYAKIAKELTKAYLSEIGARMGRNHSSVINQLNRFEADIKGPVKEKYDHVLNKCKLALETYN